MCADNLRGGSTVGGYEIVTTKEVPMIFRVESGKLQFSQDNGGIWRDAEFTGDATAIVGDILSGKIAYANGTKLIGTIPSKGAATITPTTTNQTIAANQYLSGVQTISGSANLVPGNIKNGVNIFGKIGTLENTPTEGTLSFSGSYASYIDQTECSMTYSIAKKELVIIVKSNSTSYENMIFELTSAPSGVTLVQSNTGGWSASNTAGQLYCCKLIGFPSSSLLYINVTANCNTRNSTADTVTISLTATFN